MAHLFTKYFIENPKENFVLCGSWKLAYAICKLNRTDLLVDAAGSFLKQLILLILY